jgi:methionyl-tRNA formyltransferase
MQTRIVFMGSPDFAVPILRALVDCYPVVGVVTQPDRPAGRGRKLTAPPIKILARELGILAIQPLKLRSDPEAMNQLQSWNANVIVVAAFGQILQADVLEMPPLGCLNVHASLLPRWRGVSPIQAAILNGDAETGVTIMKMDEGVDTGPILSKRVIPIETDDTGGMLFEKLAQHGAELLIDTLPGYLNGELFPQPQGDSSTPYASILKKSDGELDFSQPAIYLSRQVRAYHPWPGTFTSWQGETLKIHRAHFAKEISLGIGVFGVHEGLPAIGTSEGLLVIDKLQPAGKKSMPGDIFLRGARNWSQGN